MLKLINIALVYAKYANKKPIDLANEMKQIIERDENYIFKKGIIHCKQEKQILNRISIIYVHQPLRPQPLGALPQEVIKKVKVKFVKGPRKSPAKKPKIYQYKTNIKFYICSNYIAIN